MDAQQIYFQPQVQVGVEGDTNRDLITSSDSIGRSQKKTTAGYNVTRTASWVSALPRSDTTIKPEVVSLGLSALSTHDLRTSLDFNSQFRSSRGAASILGRFDRESTYSSELASAEFNQIANLPTTPQTGRISTDSTLTIITAVPKYVFDLTQRLQWTLTGTFQDVDYGGTGAAFYVPYSYYLGGTSLTWIFNERFDTNFGVFSSHEAGRDNSGQVNADGVNLGFDYKWSKLFTGSIGDLGRARRQRP